MTSSCFIRHGHAESRACAACHSALASLVSFTTHFNPLPSTIDQVSRGMC
jgi:hypothetical protein